MKNRLALVALSLILIAPGAFAQSVLTSEQPDARALVADWQSLQNDMVHVSHGLEELLQASQRQVAHVTAEYEARLNTAMEWLKAAQAEAASPKK